MRRERRVSHVKLIYDAERGVMVPSSGGADGRRASAPRVCYVDDSRTSSYVTLKILRQYGYQVEAFSTAEDALEALMERDYDLILTDLVLSHGGGMNGDDLVRVVRQCGLPEKENLPTVVITGDRDSGVVERLHQAGVDEVLMKPVKGRDLNQVLQRLLARQEAAPVLDDALGHKQGHVPPESATKGTDEARKGAEPAASPVPEGSTEVVTQIIDGFEDFDRPSIFSDLQDPLKARRPTAPGGTATQGKAPPPKSPMSRPATAGPPAPPPPESRPTSPAPPPRESSEAIPRRPPLSSPPPPPQSEAPRSRETSKGEGESGDRCAPGRSHASSHPQAQEALREDSLLSLLDDLESESTVAGGDDPPVRRRALGVPLLLVTLVLVVSAAGYGAWSWWQGREPEVRLTAVERGPIYESIHATGRVVSDRFVDVTSHDPGQLVEVLVKEGDRVEKGQVLARMDDQEAHMRVKRMEATLLALEEEVARANKNRERLNRAFQVGAVSRRSLDDAEAEWSAASARLTVAQEEFSAAKLDLERTRIKAPFAGIVTEVKAHAGQWVAPPQPILHLVDDARKVVRLRVDAADSGRLAPGQTVILSSEAFPDRRWQERVIRIAPSSAANVVEVEVSLGRNAPPLRLGQPVTGEIRLHGQDRAAKLPLEALVERDGRTMVMVVRDGRIHYLPVETGIEDFTHVEIKNGLQPGDQVVLPQGGAFAEGQAVRVIGLDG